MIHSNVVKYHGGTHIHVHHYEFYIFLEGKASYYINNREYLLTTGDSLLVQPGTVHTVISNDSVPYGRIVVHFNNDFMQNIRNKSRTVDQQLKSCINNLYKLSQKEISQISVLVDMAFTESKNLIEETSDIKMNDFYELMLIDVLRYYSDRAPKSSYMPELMIDAFNYIDTAFSDSSLSIERISDHLGVSRSTLSHTFQEYCGDSVWQYVIYRRLANAQELLLRGYSVTDACYECGFTNYSNFIKAFTRIYGMTPSRYGKAYRVNAQQGSARDIPLPEHPSPFPAGR